MSIHERLDKLEKTVGSLLASNNHVGNQERRLEDPSSSSQAGESSQAAWETGQTCLQRGEPLFEGQADMASRMPQLPTLETDELSPVADEVRNLRAAIHHPTATMTSKETSLDAKQLRTPQLPASVVITLLQILKKTPRLLFVMHPINGWDYVESLAQRVYFPVEPISTGELTVFYGILYNGIREILEQDQTSHIPTPQFKHYQDVCYKAFRAGVQAHELYAVPNYANILALTIAFQGNLEAQWHLTSAAARHCLTLGYHRESTMQHLPPEEAKSCRRLFWHVYLSSQSMVLSLGKAPLIHEYDVDLQLPATDDDPSLAPWNMALNLFTKFFTLQANVYKNLYSPFAASLPPESRLASVEELSTTLREWYRTWSALDYSLAQHSKVFHVLFSPTKVAYYSLLALIYRASATSSSIEDVSEECFTAAREGLEAHLSLYPPMSAMGAGALQLYAVWVFTRSTFTPYIITFVHCISHADRDDLETLRKVADTLDEIAAATNSCERQVGVCRALHRTAQAFIDSNQTRPRQDQMTPCHDGVVHLPLQNYNQEPFDWDLLQSSMNDWVVEGMMTAAVNLGSDLNANGPHYSEHQ
ncbi:putative transcriptional regulatory protein [Metarhizium anisopliae]